MICREVVFACACRDGERDKGEGEVSEVRGKHICIKEAYADVETK